MPNVGKSTLFNAVSNSAKAQAKLGWRAKTGVNQLIPMMVDADLRRVERE